MAVGSMTPPPFFCITKSEVKRMTDFLISSTVCYYALPALAFVE